MASESTDRLNQISAELATLLEERLKELATAMKAAEQATRQVVNTESEILRYRQLQDSLSGEMGELTHQIDAFRARAEEVRTQRNGMATERDHLREQVDRFEREVRDTDTQIEEQRRRLRDEVCAAPCTRVRWLGSPDGDQHG